jgi:hypothetical protein
VTIASLRGLAGCELLLGMTDKVTGDDGPSFDVASDPDLPCSAISSALFCDDFDHETSFEPRWTFPYARNGGMVFFDSSHSVSPPSSAGFTEPLTMAAQAMIGLQGLAVPGSSVEIGLDVRIDIGSLAGIPQVGIVEMAGSNDAFTINYIIGPGETATL